MTDERSATITDEDIVTLQVGRTTPYAADDTADTSDDSGDTSDTSDTGDDSGDTSDTSDTGDDGTAA
jgi:hypothetical protein